MPEPLRVKLEPGRNGPYALLCFADGTPLPGQRGGRLDWALDDVTRLTVEFVVAPGRGIELAPPDPPAG